MRFKLKFFNSAYDDSIIKCFEVEDNDYFYKNIYGKYYLLKIIEDCLGWENTLELSFAEIKHRYYHICG